MSNFYITTPIYYVNDVPHLGHAYTTIVADTLARFHRANGADARFLTGTDEHGLKVEQAARARDMQPIELANEVVERFRQTWKRLDIANDDFIRTTDDRHKRVVSEMWKRIADNGDIYKGSYDGWYCVSCEAYYPEDELAEGRLCPTHKKEATWLSEPTYFFRMSRYQDQLLEHFEKHPDFVLPENYRNEVLSFVRSGLRDLSVSRTTFQWGIPVPGDSEHVIYVWIDALTNYMSALGPIDGALHHRHWPATCHLIGKDILKFHAVYWPTMLLSAGLPLPKTILAHGWWTVRGEKISKSLPATKVDPNELSEDIGVDALRYYVMREVPLGLDGDFTYEALVGRYNAELANDLGNLVSRSLTLTSKFANGKVPEQDDAVAQTKPHSEVAAIVKEVIEETQNHMLNYAPSRALESIWRLVREANRYLGDTQPWILAKDPSKKSELDHCLRTALETIAVTARMIACFMPSTAQSILELLGMSADDTRAALSTWPRSDSFGSELKSGAATEKSRILFPRIDDARKAELLRKWIPNEALIEADSPPPPAAAAKPTAAKAAKAAVAAPAQTSDSQSISFDQFGQIDLRVAVIVEAEAVPKAKKLLKVMVDVGEASHRQVVAGIAGVYQPSDLIGKKVIFLANLAPATIRGVESQGMILAAGDKDVLGLSAVDCDVPPGTKIR